MVEKAISLYFKHRSLHEWVEELMVAVGRKTLENSALLCLYMASANRDALAIPSIENVAPRVLEVLVVIDASSTVRQTWFHRDGQSFPFFDGVRLTLLSREADRTFGGRPFFFDAGVCLRVRDLDTQLALSTVMSCTPWGWAWLVGLPRHWQLEAWRRCV